MIHRKAEIALQRLASQFPIVGITGPRQSGKSTLAKMTFPQKKYISFDDKSIRFNFEFFDFKQWQEL